MGWLLLSGAIASEVVGTVALKYTNGLSRPLPIAVVVVAYVISFALLAFTLRHLSLGVAYAVWAGVGTAAIALIGVLLLHESLGGIQAACIGLIVLGVVGLNAAGGH